MDQATVSVNGTLYNRVTGLPILGVDANSTPAAVEVEQQTTDQVTTSPAPLNPQAAPQSSTPATRPQSMAVTKFAPRTVTPSRPTRLIRDIGPATHPIVKKVEPKLASQMPKPVAKPATAIKQEAIQDALERAPLYSDIKPIKTPRRAPRVITMVLLGLILLFSVGYFTYTNLPHLSIYMAAAKSGVKASYPSYRPDGYRLSSVGYDNTSVSLEFKANGGPQSYTIKQSQTTWDSTAVNENVVKEKWGDDAVPYSERGLTIYAHDGNAVWVNGGILYEISGDAQLSPSQIRSIATSL